MSKEHYKIDEMYRLEMQDAELPIDSSAMWDELDLMMDEKKKKRRAIIFFWGLGLAAFILAALAFFNPEQQKNNISKSNDKSVIQKTENDKGIDKDNSIAKTMIQETSPTYLSTKLNNGTPISSSTIDKIKNTNNDSKYESNTSNISSTNTFAINNRKPFIITDESQNTLGSINPNTLKPTDEILTTVESSIPQIATDKELVLRNQLAMSPLLQLKPIDLDLFKISKPKIDFSKISFPGIDVKKSGSDKFELSYSIAYYQPMNKTLEPYSSIVFSYGHQINLSYDITKNISGSVGIERLDIFEKFRWVKTIESTEDIYSDTAYYYSSNGVVNFVGDTLSTTYSTIKTRQTANQHTLWSIPIGLNLTKSYNRWSLGIEAQAVFNLKHSFNGLVAQEEEVVQYDKSMKNYKTSIGIMYNLQPRLEYIINARTNISLGIPLRLSSKNWFGEGRESLDKWNAIGVQLRINVKVF